MVGTVKPAVVFVTGLYYLYHFILSLSLSLCFLSGDITDAKGADQLSSTQESREWHIYRDILNQSHAHLKDIPWIDLRGNHGKTFLLSSFFFFLKDAFNVPWKYHREDMYR